MWCTALASQLFSQVSFVGKNETALWSWSWFPVYINICTMFFGFLTEPAIHFSFPQGKFLPSSLEMPLKNLEIVKSRCHNCLEHSEKEEKELSWEVWQFATKKLLLKLWAPISQRCTTLWELREVRCVRSLPSLETLSALFLVATWPISSEQEPMLPASSTSPT